jgi:hypothetical protein
MHAHSSHQPHNPNRHPPICHRLHSLIRVFIHRAAPQWHPRAYALSHSVRLSLSFCLPRLSRTRAHIKPLSKSHNKEGENVRERQDPQQSCLLVDNDETVKVVVNQFVDHVAQRVTQQTRLISVSVWQHVRVCVCVSRKASSKHTRTSL